MSATSFLSGEHRPYAVGEIQANLSLLGFGAEDSSSDSAATKILADDGLFAHSDHNAFQQIIHFLFSVLDPAECHARFRPCWPVVERKQEADFRRTVSAWYKELQADNKSVLPMVNVSIFQTPGGNKKFVNFVQEFSRFVVLSQIKKLRDSDDLPLLDGPSCGGMSSDQAALCEAAYRSRAAANVATRSAVETAVEAAVREASEFVEENATEYRKLKAQSEELERSQSEALEAGGYSSLEVLRSEAERLKAAVEEIEGDLRPHIESMASNLNAISSVISASAGDCEQSVYLAPMRPSSSTSSAGDVVDQLVKESVAALSRAKMTPVDLPVTNIAESGDKIAKHFKAMSERRALLKEESIPELRKQIRELSGQRVNHEVETKCIGLPECGRSAKWHIEVFDDGANNDASRLLSLIPNRGVGHACDDGEGSSSLKNAPYHSSKSVRSLPPSESTAYGYFSQSEVEGATKVAAEDASASLFLFPSSGSASGPHQPPLGIGAQFQPQRVASGDESKMSAFSPILSSSRMEQTRLSEAVPPAQIHQQRHYSAAATSRFQQHLNDLSIRSGASGGDRSNTRYLANATPIHPSDDLSVISELRTPETSSSSGATSIHSAFTGHKIKEFRLDLESILSDKENEIPEGKTKAAVDFERILAASNIAANPKADNNDDDDEESSDGSFAKPSLIDFGDGPHLPHRVGPSALPASAVTPETPRTASNRKLASRLDDLMSTLGGGEAEGEYGLELGGDAEQLLDVSDLDI